MLVAMPKMQVVAVPFIEIGFWRAIPSKNSLDSVNRAKFNITKFNFWKRFVQWTLFNLKNLISYDVVSVQSRYTGISITLFVRVSIYTSQIFDVKLLWGLIYPLLLVISHFFVVRFLSSIASSTMTYKISVSKQGCAIKWTDLCFSKYQNKFSLVKVFFSLASSNMTYEISLGQAVLLRELILFFKIWINMKSYYDFMVFSTLCFYSKDSSVL